VQGSSYHTPVLLEETLSFLIKSKSGVYVDATLGGGGHAEAIVALLENDGRLIGLDADNDALQFATIRLSGYRDRFIARKGNFKEFKKTVLADGVVGVDGALFDLGVSSFQLNEPTKGFSFRSDSPLDMRMDRTQALSAHEVVNAYDERRLSQIFREYGEERNARRIARAVVSARSARPLESGKDLVRVVEGIVGDRFLTKTLARVFQAIRIEVNRELENLTIGLSEAIDVLNPGGRLVVISYHSLEDRIVKETLKAASATSDTSLSKFLPAATLQPRLRILTKKFVGPSDSEVRANPRARSAKLRAAEKI
jgi:16S rRNA (cytosine1402-N4)-methyltransferase